MKKSLVISLVLLLAVGAAIFISRDSRTDTTPAQPTGTTQSQTTVSLKFSTAAPATSTWHEGATRFAEIVGEKTDGKFEIRIFPSDELSGGNQVAGIELVQTGATDIHLQDALVWAAVAKRGIVPCFPWLLPTYDDVDKYMRGAGGETMKGVISESGVVCLAIGENGYRQVVNTRGPITSPSDMAGLKMRVPGSNVHVALLKYIGADPLTMSQSEVYTSLQQGTIDACENTLDLLFTQNTLEVTKYISLWNYSYDPLYLSVSNELWDSLSDAEKTIFQEAADEAMAYQIGQARAKEAELVTRLGEYNMAAETLTPEQIDVFKAVVAPIYSDYKDEIGGDLFNSFGHAF